MIHWTDEQIQAAYDDFRVFLYIVWLSVCNLPEPTPLQYDIARLFTNLPSKRFILQAFRGAAKSFIACAYCVWRLWRNPNLKVLIVSANKDRAADNAVFIKKIINNLYFLEHLKPRADQRNTQNAFDVAPASADIQPSVKSIGITGQLTGARADLILADDVEIPKNSGTQALRDKIAEAIKEFSSIIKPGGDIIYLGTPQCEMSLYNTLQAREHTTVIYPIRYPETPERRKSLGDRLAPFIAQPYDSDPEKYAGKSTEPGRFNEADIDSKIIEYGKAGFALQFMLDTSLSDIERYPLKVSDLIITDLDIYETSLKWIWATGREQRQDDIPCVAFKGDYYYNCLERSKETMKYTGTVIVVDPSGRGKDETAYAVLKYLNGYIFLMEVGGFQDGYSDETLEKICRKAKFYGANECVYEPNFGDGMFGKLLTPIMNRIHPGCPVNETKRSTTQKEQRIIDTLEPVMMRHKLIVQKQVIVDDYNVYQQNDRHSYSLFYQLTRICKDKGALAHDDRLDAVALGVAYWLEVMDKDEQMGMEEHAADQLEKWLDPDYGITHMEEPDGYNQNIYDNYNVLSQYGIYD